MISFLTTPAARWIGGAILVIALLLGVYAKGRMDEHKVCVAYKAEVQAAAQAQEAKTKQIEDKNRRINEETKNAYNTRLANLRSYYGMRFNKSGGNLSEVSRAATGTDGYTIDNLPDSIILAGQCAETTVTLLMLQDWVSRINEAAE